MARCWTCGAHIESPSFTCSTCRNVAEIRSLREGVGASLSELAEVQRNGFEDIARTLSDGLTGVATVIEWGFEELSWQLHQQTSVLESIDQTLKTPSETQANEWRVMAEELRRRGVFDKSEEFFLKALERNPLDYRIYVGLAESYIRVNRFNDARSYLEKSLPHAPKETEDMWGESVLEMSEEERNRRFKQIIGMDQNSYESTIVDIQKKPSEPRVFDYRSYSYRLIGHIYACMEQYPEALLALRSAVELSPHYYEAVYDLAQYAAQVRDKQTCLSALRSAIDSDYIYFYLVKKERNFDPASAEIADLLNELSIDASDKAKAELSN